MIEIMAESPGDLEAIGTINQQAFGQDQEADLVEALRSHDAIGLSPVALLDDQAVGRILYSPMTIGEGPVGAALGPMAVLPQY